MMQPPPGLADPPQSFLNQYFLDMSKMMNFHQSNQTLESLKLELNQEEEMSGQKREEEDQIELVCKEGLCYLEPTLNNLSFTGSGCVVDTAGSDYLGIWDKDMKFKQVWEGLLENVASSRILPLPGERLLVSQFTSLYLIHLNDGKRDTLWQASKGFDVIFLSNHCPRMLFAFAEGEFYVWSTNWEGKRRNSKDYPTFNCTLFSKPGCLQKNDFLELKHSKATRFFNCDDLLVLDNGIILGKNQKQGEVYEINVDKDKITELSLTQDSIIQDWKALDWDRVAMSRQSSIILVLFKTHLGQIYATLNAGTEDVMQGLILMKYNRLASISNKGVIKVYDLNKNLCTHSHGTEKKLSSLYSLKTVDSSTIAMICVENKEFQLLNVVQNDQNIKLENYFTYKARVRRVLECIVQDEYIVIYQQSGLFFQGQVDFHKEIQIYGGYDNKFIRKKVVGDIDPSTILITEGSLQIEDSSSDESFHSNNDKPFYKDICLRYIKNKTIHSWFFLLNKTKEQQINLNCSSVVCKQYIFNRLVVNYSDREQTIFHNNTNNHKNPKSNQFNLFEPTIKKSTTSQELYGIKVYDDEIELMIDIPFNQQCHIFGMLNRDLLYFVNSKNQIESWSMATQKVVQKADCRPALIKQVFFLGDSLFMFASQEWIVRDSKLAFIGKRKGNNQLQKVLKINGNMVVVQERQQLVIWRVKENTLTPIDCGFMVASIAYLQENRLLVVGDCEMKILNIDS